MSHSSDRSSAKAHKYIKAFQAVCECWLGQEEEPAKRSTDKHAHSRYQAVAHCIVFTFPLRLFRRERIRRVKYDTASRHRVSKQSHAQGNLWAIDYYATRDCLGPNFLAFPTPRDQHVKSANEKLQLQKTFLCQAKIYVCQVSWLIYSTACIGPPCRGWSCDKLRQEQIRPSLFIHHRSKDFMADQLQRQKPH